LLEEKNIHLAFEVSLFLKGAFAVAEIVTGIGGMKCYPSLRKGTVVNQAVNGPIR
jgi:uncharacterized membrane protein